ncbi:hypothetical protein KAFR_0D03140 [Kazachstania africana CBS 2517]|uniref:DNA replication regulator SLD2 n=1 Tax=Kazachstania africana (strain ATCC 22294 / BCRC 22015 / CBS 2517 / CECT 1963 / NBRC 1671 / NRRL Y-8276) TaxID=1071382 RepID=H2AUB2_KAZAF|nr:hypothetical protein KAFR_0D03140 [Kazachstania africana CBS 2517]CCF57962.1 hypothetical protein KAFR_0D03140 [Kazachstania africana CBS 2517]
MDQEELLTLRKELKTWEHDFIQKFNKSPKKKDIELNHEIKLKYKKYSNLKKRKHDQQITYHSPIRLPSQEITEVGPTPQIFGTSISIFDLNLSPVKRKLILNDNNDDNAAAAADTDDDEDDEEDDKLIQDVEPRRLIERHSKYGPNSPMKFSLNKNIKFKTPTKLNENITSMSPSPIWKKSLNKTLKQLEDEFNEIQSEFGTISPKEEQEGQEERKDQEEQEGIQESQPVKKRNIKEKPLGAPNLSPIKINLPEKLKKLKKQQLNSFFNETIDENTESEPEEKQEVIKTKPKRKKKYNLVSNNFRRLKLPSRKKNNFKRRRL